MSEQAEPIVLTQTSKNLKKGIRGELECAVHIDVLGVYWYKDPRQSTDTSINLLIYVDLCNGEFAKHGPGYLTGTHNMTDTFSLVINDVQVKDEGRYYCHVFEARTKTTFQNFTDVTVEGM